MAYLNCKIGEIVGLMIPVKVFRDLGETADVCTDNGDCLVVSKKQLLKYTNKEELTMKAMKDAVLAVAKNLLKANNTVTTLEIKTELRRDYPYYYWDQQTVSTFMSQLSGDGIFDYTDNGTYRTYRHAGTLANKPQVTTQTGAMKGLFGKVSGKVASQTPVAAPVAKKKGRPKKSSNSNVITHQNAINLVANGGFDSLTLRNGKVINTWDIATQKKTPLSYVSRAKTIATITINNKTYILK